MSDAGEGLVDAEARLQEQLDAREHERRRRSGTMVKDPDRLRRVESLRLARIEAARQFDATEHPVRRDQLSKLIADLDQQIAAQS